MRRMERLSSQRGIVRGTDLGVVDAGAAGDGGAADTAYRVAGSAAAGVCVGGRLTSAPGGCGVTNASLA
jgi:hypothetical protein